MTTIPEASTIAEWSNLLHQLIDGDWEELVDTLGSVDEVVRVAIRDADDPVSARSMFEVAFNQVVSMWDPNTPMLRYALHNLFDLISSFTPPEGFPKIMGQLENPGFWISYADDKDTSPTASIEDKKRALHALEEYFHSPPTNAEVPAFRGYRALLESNLDSEFGPYCLRRLLELHVLKPGEDVLVKVLLKQPTETIMELIGFVLDSNSGLRSTILSNLFAAVGRNWKLKQFEEVISRFGCVVVRRDQAFYMVTPFGELEIWLSDYPDVVDQMMLRALRGGLDRLRPELQGLFT
jgi:hypothetical protein